VIEGLVRSIHPEKVFEFLPGMTTVALARLYGLDEATYRAYREQFVTQVDRAADGLLAEDDIAAALESLPFAEIRRVAAAACARAVWLTVPPSTPLVPAPTNRCGHKGSGQPPRMSPPCPTPSAGKPARRATR
jgi:hypothetical protein